MKCLPLLLISLAAACASPQVNGGVEPRASSTDADRTALLRDLEQQIEDAISRRDPAFLDRLTAPTFTRTDLEGRVEDRATVFGLIRQPPPTSDIIRRTVNRSTQQVQLHGDVVVTRTEVEVRGPRRAFRSTQVRVYRWRAPGWQLLSSTTISMTPLTP